MAKQWPQLERLDHKALKKLQAEREKAAKAAQAAEEFRKRMFIGAGVLVVFLIVIGLVMFVNKKNAEKARQEARSKLLFSNVTEFSGDVEFRKKATWETLTKNLSFDEEHSFKTDSDSSITIQMQLDNQVKLHSKTEATIKVPVLDKEENKVNKEGIELTSGEITAAVTLDGRDIMSIDVSNIHIIGQSGLFKVLYDSDADKGEVVVKNGLVQVSRSDDKSTAPVKLSGFYKVVFAEGELSSPTQASVIQYDWR